MNCLKHLSKITHTTKGIFASEARNTLTKPFVLQKLYQVICYSLLLKSGAYFFFIKFLADPGKARGCFTNTSVVNWLPLSKYLYGTAMTYWLKTMLSVIKKTLLHFFKRNSKSWWVMAILLNGWILPIGISLVVEGLWSIGLPRLDLYGTTHFCVTLVLLIQKWCYFCGFNHLEAWPLTFVPLK